MAILISFDIDGTMEFGDPPGGITVEMVRRAKEMGFIIGSCSDRPTSSQSALWERYNVPVDFVVPKHGLPTVKERFDVAEYFHIGDRDTDQQYAQQAGFVFYWTHEALDEPWIAFFKNMSSK